MTAHNNFSLLNQVGIKKFYPAIGWFILVLILICIPGSDLPKPDDWMIKINFDKFVHMGLFSVLAFLFMYPAIKSNLTKKQIWMFCIKITLATIVWGYTTETIQKYFIPGRSYDLSDWLADSIGGVIALLFMRFYFLKKDKAYSK